MLVEHVCNIEHLLFKKKQEESCGDQNTFLKDIDTQTVKKNQFLTAKDN
jgi:hypothetical protein